MLRVLGMKDMPDTTREFIAKWDEKCLHETKLDLADAGHFWQEDETGAGSAAIREAFVPVAVSR